MWMCLLLAVVQSVCYAVLQRPPKSSKTDVSLILGLVTAYQLAKFGGVSVSIIEKHTKSTQDTYGRAITLYPRSTEILDQLGLAEDLAQKCFACRSTVSYDAKGTEVPGRGWYFMENMKDTQWDFALVLRQKYQEEIFRQKLREEGVALEAPVELTHISDLYPKNGKGYKIKADVRNGVSGAVSSIMCKYLIGADGGRSFVRSAYDIPFDGSTSEDKWVRIDGIIETNMPKNRVYGAIESPTHGNVLWAALDHGATRIGFAFTAERQNKYTEFNEAAAVAEAIASIKPFSLTFKTVDWFTVYTVGQRIARKFFINDSVFLAGDACHTHSSGAAQGMNTGMHDSVNLGWKLSLVLRGQALPSLLNTYEDERLPNVQKLINYDKDISRLMTMQLPIGWKGDPKADPNEILGVVMEEASTFTSGLSIAFPANIINQPSSFIPLSESAPGPGQRGPDVSLQKPGTFEMTRLHRETPNVACFHVVVFAGEPDRTMKFLTAFSGSLDRSTVFAKAGLPINWITIPAVSSPSAFELLGGNPFGKVFFDREKTAHERYGVDLQKGSIVVLRPDGWIGTVLRLGGEAVADLERYFAGFLSL
jgi:phenol 2-monooxygenase